MADLMIEKKQIKPIILEVLNDLFNFGDIEEAKRTPIGRLINLEAKVETLVHVIQNLESSLRAEMNAVRAEINAVRAEMKAMKESNDARFEQINSRLAFLEKQLYVVLAALFAGLIKVFFF